MSGPETAAASVAPTEPATGLPSGLSTGLPTGEVARRLGVSPVTLRSWERRYGIGPAQRGAGRHRRWTAADIARLETMCRLTAQGLPPAEAARLVEPAAESVAAGPAQPPPRVGRRGTVPSTARPEPSGQAEALTPRRLARGLIRAADRLDAPGVQELLTTSLDHWGVEAAWEEVIAPALRATGRRWAVTGETYVEVEHLLSWHVSAELRARATVRTGSGPVALLAATPGEEHTLPLDALAAALAARGVGFRMLGASVPAQALAHSHRRLGPAALLLWSQSHSTAAPQLAADLRERSFGVPGARHQPLLLLGGPGWRSVTTPPGAVRPAGLRAAVQRIAAAVTRLGG